MKWGAVLGITIVVALLVLYEWPTINPQRKKERIAFIGLTAIGWLLGVLLVFFPDMPNPTQLFEAILKPLTRLLEK